MSLRICLLIIALLGAGVARADDLSLQRELFTSALGAVTRGDEQQVAGLSLLLQDYPLYDYLIYRWLAAQLKDDQAIDDEVRDFMEEHPGRLAWRLRVKWLYQLAEREQWRQLVDQTRADDPDRLRCAALGGRRELGELQSLDASARELWMRPGSLPRACLAVFEALFKQTAPDPGMVWERIGLAMARGQIGVALALSKWLSDSDKSWVELWIKAYQTPAEVFDDDRLQSDELLARRVLRTAIERLAQRDAELAAEYWRERRNRYRYSYEQRIEVDRYVALRTGYQYLPAAWQRLSAIPHEFRNKGVHSWRTRVAIFSQQWADVLVAVADMPETLRTDEGWRYWHAYSLRETGQTEQALAAFRALATETSYYGFLAADEASLPYRFNDEPVALDPKALGELQQDPLVIRAREFLYHELEVEARRVWNQLLRSLDRSGKFAAASIASSWGWHDRAVYTMAQTAHLRDYTIRFPMPYQQPVADAAQEFSVDTALIYGVIRRESAFRADARSRAGALGLMQLLPSTGRRVAGQLGIKASGPDLIDVSKNIRFGTKYLHDMLERFDGHRAKALAAYNAGPHRVRRWIPEQQPVPAPLWVDTLPFRETRRYVRAVMAYTAIFEWRSGREVVPLKERMPPIPAVAVAVDELPLP